MMGKAAKLRRTFNSVTRDYRRRRRDNGVPEASQRRHFAILDDFTGLPRTLLSAWTMYATINELSQECFSMRTDFMKRKRHFLFLSLFLSLHFPVGTERDAFCPQIIAQ